MIIIIIIIIITIIKELNTLRLNEVESRLSSL